MRWNPVLLLAGCLAMATARAGDPGTPAPALTATEIVERLVERARSATNRMAETRVAFQRHTVIEELDRRGEVSDRTTKEHRVVLDGLDQQVRLVRINGRPLTPKESEAERRREEENRRRYAQRGDRARAGNREFLDEKLIRRFRYELLGVEEVGGRTAYLLRFQPLGDPDHGSIADRILSRLGGRLWVDADEFELVAVDARLGRPLPILGNVVGSVDDLGFTVTRLRLPNGVWVNTGVGSHATGRKLVVPFRVRMSIREEGFRVLTGDAEDGDGAAAQAGD